MNQTSASNTTRAGFWAVAQTVSRRESFAAERIAEAGFDVFTPQIKIGQYANQRIVALFPGYLFVRIVDRWIAIAKTIGVLGLIMNGERPARCPDSEVDKIKSQAMPNGLIRLPIRPPKPRFENGQPVRIASGSFRGLDAVYAGMSPHERQCVLLNMLGRETRVELAADDVLTCRTKEFPLPTNDAPFPSGKNGRKRAI